MEIGFWIALWKKSNYMVC